jgi:hypothetical protein
MAKYMDDIRTPARIADAVTDDVHRAARLIDSGLWLFGAFTRGAGTQAEIAAAAEAADEAGEQVEAALTEARRAWRAERAAAAEAGMADGDGT